MESYLILGESCVEEARLEQGYKTGVLALCIPANTTFPYTILSEQSVERYSLYPTPRFAEGE